LFVNDGVKVWNLEEYRNSVQNEPPSELKSFCIAIDVVSEYSLVWTLKSVVNLGISHPLPPPKFRS
jgi:hypothetical protein